MKKLILIVLLIFSSPSYADYTQVTETEAGNTVYVDFNRIRQVDGYHYVWRVTNFLTPDEQGYLPLQIYEAVDCRRRYAVLQYSFLGNIHVFYRHISRQTYVLLLSSKTNSGEQWLEPTGGIRGGVTGVIADGSIGHTLGGHSGGKSILLEHIG